jgi:hypothetical protein
MTGATRCGVTGANVADVPDVAGAKTGAANAGDAKEGAATGAGGLTEAGFPCAARCASISAAVMLRSMMTETSGSFVSTRCGGA